MIDPKVALKTIQDSAAYLRNNAELIDILEGNLLPYLDDELKRQLSFQSYTMAQHRIAAINILPKIIDKLTNIYQTSVTREVIDGTDSDKALLAWYEEQLDLNNTLNCANELFNLCKATAVHPFVYEKKPYLRVMMNDKFVPFSSDSIIPNRPTDMIISAGKRNNKDVYWVFGQDGFYAMDGDGALFTEEMLRLNNIEGVNIYGTLPFVYVADSKYKLIPTQDTDFCKMVKVIPIMLTDLNLAAMFQSFSIVYGIDVDDENLKRAPNAFWALKSDPTSNVKPEIGTIKPEVDYQQVLSLIEAELSMWLGSRGIRASTVGALTQDNFASGISKIIDEMDTYEARQKQVTVFQKFEQDLWNLLFRSMHPEWVRLGLIENNTLFSPNAKVVTKFAVQLPQQSRGQVVKDLQAEFAAGFTTRKKAIMILNPEMTSVAP